MISIEIVKPTTTGAHLIIPPCSKRLVMAVPLESSSGGDVATGGYVYTKAAAFSIQIHFVPVLLFKYVFETKRRMSSTRGFYSSSVHFKGIGGDCALGWFSNAS